MAKAEVRSRHAVKCDSHHSCSHESRGLAATFGHTYRIMAWWFNGTRDTENKSCILHTQLHTEFTYNCSFTIYKHSTVIPTVEGCGAPAYSVVMGPICRRAAGAPLESSFIFLHSRFYT